MDELGNNNLIERTVDSVVREQNSQQQADLPDEVLSKAGTVKFEKQRDTTGQNSGRLTHSKRGGDDPAIPIDIKEQQQTGVSVRMNESDIRIVTKDRGVSQDIRKTDLLQLHSQLDKRLLTFSVTRDPKSAKTLPANTNQHLMNTDESRFNQNQKIIFSQRDTQHSQQNHRPSKSNQKHEKQQLSVQSETNHKPVQISAATIHLTINHQARDGIDSKEIRLLDSRETAEMQNIDSQRAVIDNTHMTFYQN